MNRLVQKTVCLAALTVAGWLPSVQAQAPTAGLEAYDLRCDGAVDPLGVDSAPPRLSWKLRSSERAQGQTAWQVLVASSLEQLRHDRGDVWDSGRREGDDQLHVPYAGRPLQSSQQVFWKVRSWNRAGRVSSWSTPASWTMGVLAAKEWHARWITDAALLRWVRAKIGYHSEETRDAAAPKWLRIDLRESRPIENVALYPIRQTMEEANGFPVRFRIEVAEDPEFAVVQTVAAFTEEDYRYTSTAAKTTVPTFVAPPGVRGRYVRLVTSRLRRDGNAHYLALSQIEITSGGRNVAPGATITASDSIESGRWSAAAVIDGKDVRGANARDNATLLARREFAAKPALRRAIVHVSGLGQYELTLNGRRVGDAVLSPGWTTYEKTALYDTFDVTALVRSGRNAMGLVLAGGMYNVRAERYGKFESLFRPLMAIAQLRLEYADGTVEHVGTDAQWRLSAAGPTTFSNIYGGEDFDARRTLAGWDEPGFDDHAWAEAVVHDGPGGVLRGASHAAPPLGTHEVLRPVAVKPLRPGVLVYDFGQNTAMMPRLRVRGAQGSVVKMIPAELLNPDGSIDTSSFMRGPNGSWWAYTLRGGVAEDWFPKFFYTGARYLQVELSAPTGAELPTVEALESVVVHTTSPAAGEFACSNELFNRIRTLVRWAQRSNAASVLTDCPHREKLGWLEQYYLNGPSLRYEFDLTRLYAKTFGDMADAQLANGLVPDIAPEFVIFSGGFRDSPEWGSAIILAAWQHLEWTGDDTPLRRYYPAMCRYADYLASRAQGHILSHGLGDWYDIGPKPPGVSQLTPLGLTATATYYADIRTLAAIAARLGRAEDAVRFDRRAEEIRAAFTRRFFDAAKGIYATGSQCANAMPLVLGLVEPADRARVLEALVRDTQAQGLTAGDVGYFYLLRALAGGGRSDVIHALNNQSEKPGYGYQLAQGATALTEAWNARRSSSHNHFMLGQITEWFYRDLAGLGTDPDAPGFKRALFRPQPVGDVTWVRATHESPRGRIVSAWKRAAGRFEYEVEIPANTTATVVVPTVAADKVIESGVPAERSPGVRRLRVEPGAVVYAVESGRYVFAAPLD
ncbi:family 78 glycoside hydrolase catalytic domain [Opitutus sp. ER46]|uniref:family 78 glycoside hydrolase catalytic domain n=1 Tax=Opitutus sp. ER46 TaxID=2161864 RepID=UPI001E52EDA8|nr:family 78 glycoside hydrolase catalytic domain [Opitutus sp. ER46]